MTRLPLRAWLGACALLAAVSLAWQHTLTYDSWSWAVWGRQVAGLHLTASGATAWKPLPVLLDALYSLPGDLAPTLWLLTARTGVLVAIVLVGRVAWRLAGPLGAALSVLAVLSITVPDVELGWADFFAVGWSEGLLVALSLGALERHLENRPDQALLLGFAAALVRPELWPFLGLYALMRWRAAPAQRWRIALLMLAVPALWLIPTWLASGHVFQASARALADVPAGIRRANEPGIVVLRLAARILIDPVKVGLLLTLAVALRQRDRTVLALAGGSAAWILLVAAMAELHYPGVPRYFIVPTTVLAMLAGVGAARLLARIGSVSLRLGLTLVVGLAVLGFGLARYRELARSTETAARQARVDHDLRAAISNAGGARAVRSCGPVATSAYNVPVVEWELGFDNGGVHVRPRRASVIVRGPRRRSTERWLLLPNHGAGFRVIGRAGPWRIFSRC